MEDLKITYLVLIGNSVLKLLVSCDGACSRRQDGYNKQTSLRGQAEWPVFPSGYWSSTCENNDHVERLV